VPQDIAIGRDAEIEIVVADNLGRALNVVRKPAIMTDDNDLLRDRLNYDRLSNNGLSQ
jgi:hypothetical protein